MTKNILQIKKKIIYILEITVKLKEKEFLIKVKKLHIREDYKSDMIAYNQAMDDYKQSNRIY